MSIDDAIAAYIRLVEQVFSEKKTFLQEGIFKATRLEQAIITVIQAEGVDPRQVLLRKEDGPKWCALTFCSYSCILIENPSFVCAMPSRNMSFPTLFRSWIPRANPSYNCTIIQAARATTAARIFFKAAKFGDPPQRYLDGELRCNNPVKYVVQEAGSLYPGRQISCLLTLGTGAGQVIGLDESNALERVFPTKILKVLHAIARDCEQRSQEMASDLSSLSNSTLYIRLNVDEGLRGLLDEWRRLGDVTTHTEQYLKKHEVGQRVDQLVQVLKGM